MNVMETIKRAMVTEGQAILDMVARIDEAYVTAVDHLVNCTGKIVLFGVGKSGIVGKKLASSFASCGIQAIFVHATEAWHGELGLIEKRDVVLLISNSGETEEVLQLLPSLQKIECTMLALTSKQASTLAKACHVTLHYSYERETDELGLMPTTSSTLALVLGDSLAVTVSQIKRLNAQTFYRNHPGGAIGKELQFAI